MAERKARGSCCMDGPENSPVAYCKVCVRSCNRAGYRSKTERFLYTCLHYYLLIYLDGYGYSIAAPFQKP
jgi:hypothetical protein